MSSISRDECVLRWTDHETLVQGVCTDLLDTERFADVTLFCSDDHRGLKCHRFILAACSSYFDGIFGNDSSLSLNFTQVAIVLKDVSRDCMEDLLHFIYRGELTVEEAKLGSFIQLAKSFGVKGLCDFTCSPPEMKKLHQHLHPAPPPDDEENEHEIEYDNDSSEQPIFIGMNSEQEEEELSEAGSNSDALLSVSTSSMGGGRSGCYKQYSEAEMQAALKWVVEGGAKSSEACLQFGIPLTTFTRRMRRYKEQLKRQEQQPTKVNKGPAVIIPLIKEEEKEEEEEDSGQEEEEEMDLVIERVESHRAADEEEYEEEDTRKSRRKQRRRESQSGIQYKTYTARQLRDAILAVQSGRMKTADASHRFGIPLTTLARKIRSSKAANGGDISGASATPSNGAE